MSRVRLDTLLAERGLFSSRSRAAASVAAGEVLVGPERVAAARPAQLVARDVPVALAEGSPRYVSRGAVKLANALDALGLDVAGRRALDVGASTGGFTDVLLRRGVERVAAVDVASGELDPSLRSDPRVDVLERVNARFLAPSGLPFAPDLLVVDVSFISAAKVLPAVLGCMARRFDALVMVKPQFEVGPARVGKNGVVREAADRRAAVLAVAGAGAADAAVLGFAPSGLPGPKGNRETFVWLGERGRAGAVRDLEAAVREVDA
ncbi:MAG TPA: TlyA family RNA methyltransferase [Solirubrobacteraceae bacterium]|jgi:23S rRNA (cytidine1920-2'-O)/16S rRNA (cytidine1409-2'-O)-methyltransferase|nr:TlyA family RNA methyltransferase [Solirubrobacteraceae bacterium]